jgi:hypothetical protein
MKKQIYIYIGLILLSNVMMSQKSEKYKIDSLLNVAISFPSKINLKRLNQEIKIKHSLNIKDTTLLNNKLSKYYLNGLNYYENQENDSAEKMLVYISEKHLTTGLKISSIDYSILYSKLYNISISKNINKAATYLYLSIKNGSDDIEDLITYYRFNSNCTHDSVFKLLHLSNLNYLNNVKYVNGDFDLIFRYLTISDQLYRIDYSNRKTIKYNIVSRNDSVLQSIFSSIILNTKGISILKNSTCQKTFDLLLLHSVYNPNDYSFFEKHFSLFSTAYFNNFIEFNSISSLMDNYLRYKYNKQFFNSEYGMDRMPDGNRKLLEKINESEIIEIFNKLGIKNPKYK